MKAILIGVFVFALPPGILFGLSSYAIFQDPIVGLIVGLCGWGLGLDVLFGKGCR